MKKSRINLAAIFVLSFVLAACGGGAIDNAPRVNISSVKTFGDSLADAGTFLGVRATIQGNDIYPEIISKQYGLVKGCNFYTSNGNGFSVNSAAGCQNYAISGAVINGAALGFNSADPRDIGMQISTATVLGNFSSNDLLLIDGGGNDVATLVEAYLKSNTAYTTVLSSLLTQSQISAASATGSNGLAVAGATYMVALADKFYTAIKNNALSKGAQRVLIINIPPINKTPRFQAVLDGFALTSGGGVAGEAARKQAEDMVNGWVLAYNIQLATKFYGESKVAIVDFYSALNDQINNPAQYGLSNVKVPVCPVVSVVDGMPQYDFPTCTDATLAANPPAGQVAGPWYKGYLFSDGFHPTPYGHQLMSQLITRSLAQVGWF